MDNERVIQIEAALLAALSLNAHPTDTWGTVKKAVCLLLAEVFSDHELKCGCGKDHGEPDAEVLEETRHLIKALLEIKRKEKFAGDITYMTPKGNA